MPKTKCEFTKQELEDIWSALALWLDQIAKYENPQNTKDVEKLIKKVRKYLK